MIYLLISLYVLVCLILITVILLQPGKGGGLGASLGSATSQQIFGGRGSTPFLEKLTIGLSVAFAVLSIIVSIAIEYDQHPHKDTNKERAEFNQKIDTAKKKIEDETHLKARELDQKAPLPGSSSTSVPGKTENPSTLVPTKPGDGSKPSDASKPVDPTQPGQTTTPIKLDSPTTSGTNPTGVTPSSPGSTTSPSGQGTKGAELGAPSQQPSVKPETEPKTKNDETKVKPTETGKPTDSAEPQSETSSTKPASTKGTDGENKDDSSSEKLDTKPSTDGKTTEKKDVKNDQEHPTPAESTPTESAPIKP